MDGAAGSHPAVGHSVLAPGGIAALVAAAYDVGRVERCLLVRTWVNDVYAVAATRGAYVAKVYRHGWRSEADVGWELALLAHLARHGASVAVALPRRDGGMTLPVAAPEGPRLLAVFEAAAGAPPRRPFTARLFHAYGRAAATLHSAARGFAMPGGALRILDLDQLIAAPMRAIRPALPARPDDLAFLEDLAARLTEGIASLAPELDWGPCHGDLSLDNLHVAPDGRITFYDLDSAGRGWRAWDISGAMHGAVPAAFAAGYREVGALDDAAMAAIPLFAATDQIRFLGAECGHLARWLKQSQASDRQVDERLQWLRRWTRDQRP